MQEFILNHDVRVKDLTKEQGTDGNGHIRIYRSSPTGAAIQLRGYGPTTLWGKGVTRNMLSTMDYVSRDELIRIRDAIQSVIDELPPNG